MAESPLRRHGPALAAAAITVLLLAEALVPGRVFFYRDLGTQFWPVLTEAHSAPGGGVDLLPFWTHASTNGRPLLANPGFSFLSPFALLWRFLPHAEAFDLFLLVHAVLAAAGMAKLARALGASPQGSLLAGLGLGLGGGVVSAHNLWWALVALGWAPWVLVAAVRAVEEPTARRCALLALALALQADGGMPEVVLCTLLVGALLTLPRAPGAWGRRILRTALRWGACGLWGIVIAAPQLVPGALHAKTTIRALGFKAKWILYNSLDPRALPGLVIPGWGGHPMHRLEGGFPGAAWTETGTPYLISCYCGAIVGLLALVAIASWLTRRMAPDKRAIVAGMTVAALLGVAVALGRHVPPVRWLVEALAPLPLRFTVKALFATFLAVPLLAAVGLDELSSRLRSARIAQPLALALALTAGLDLMVAHEGYLPTVELAALDEPPLSKALKARAEQLGVRDGEWYLHHQRFELGEWGPPPGSIRLDDVSMHLWQRRVLMPPLGMAHGIRHSYDRLGDLLEDVRMVRSAADIYALPRPEWARELGEAGVLFVISPLPDLEAESGGTLVLEHAIGPQDGVPEGSGYVYRDTAFRPRLEMIGSPSGSASVESFADDHRGTTIRVRTANPATLVIREALGDLASWRARAADGRDLELVRANECFAALDVPAGETTIRLSYLPPGWNASLAMATLGLGAAAIALVLGRLRRTGDAQPRTQHQTPSPMGTITP